MLAYHLLAGQSWWMMNACSRRRLNTDEMRAMALAGSLLFFFSICVCKIDTLFLGRMMDMDKVGKRYFTTDRRCRVHTYSIHRSDIDIDIDIEFAWRVSPSHTIPHHTIPYIEILLLLCHVSNP